MSDTKRICAEPCNGDSDCWAGECVETEGEISICRTYKEDMCETDDDCPPSHICFQSTTTDDPRFCRSDYELKGSTRHECTENEECETPGLICTLDNSMDGDGRGRCNFPCDTTIMVCPGMHSCFEVITGTSAVCEWVGE